MVRRLLVTLLVMMFCTGLTYADGWNELTDAERTWLKQHPVIRLGVDPQWAPFEYVENGKYKGLAADYIDLVSAQLGIDMQLVPNLSWPQVLSKAEAKELDLLPAAMKSAQREQYLSFTSSYLNFPMVIISQRGTYTVRSLAALSGKKVGVVSQYISHELLRNNHPDLKLVPVSTLTQGLEKLSVGEIDFFIDNVASASHVIRTLGLTNLQIAAHTPYSFQLGMAVRSDWPELVSILDKSLMAINDRQHRLIQRSWFELPTVFEQRIRNYLGVLVAFVAICVIAMFLALIWVKRLRKEVVSRQKAERALRNSESRLLDSQRIASIGSWQWYPEKDELYWTDEVFRILDIAKNANQMSHACYMNRVHDDDRANVQQAINRAIERGERIRLQHRTKLSNGEERHVELQGCFDHKKGRLDGTVQDITERKRIELFFRGLTEDVARNSGYKYFEAMTCFLSRSFGVEYAFIGMLDENEPQTVTTLSIYAKGRQQPNFSYSLRNTPCENVIQERVCIYPDHVQEMFPADELLVKMDIVGYAGIPIYDTAGRCKGLVVLMDDKPLRMVESIRSLMQITASRVSAELQRQSLVQQLQLTASVFENTCEGILIADAQKRIVAVNHGFCAATGFSEEETLGKLPEELFCPKHHDERFHDGLWWEVNRTGSWQGEVWNLRKEGDAIPCIQSIEQVVDDRDNVLQYISVFTDITEQKRSEERIQYLAHYDVLTDLPNRILFNDRLKHAIERASRQSSRLSVLFIDLDRFKYVNDTLGHQQGDLLLKKVAERLKECVRQADTVARLGGDEFTILLEDVERPDMLAGIADKILSTLSESIELDGHQAVVGCSIGLSVYPDDGGSAEQLLKHADTAMYYAKENGRNTYAFYSPELSRSSYEHFRLENELRTAIERQQFLLHYQPQLEVGSDGIFTVEALVRWQLKSGELVPPDSFIPLAEETGLIVPMGEWILNSACAQARQWNKKGLKIRVAVNISGIQIMRSGFVETVEKALEASGLPPHLLELEVTESYVMNHIEGVVETLTRVRELGVTLSIDDFGTGYSSLSYLKQLPVDVLKIDRSFISDIPMDSDDEKIASAIIAMAHNLSLKVVAEGVETQQQLQFLKQRGCDLAQGYFIARPMTADMLEDFMRDKSRKVYAVS